MVWVSVRVKVRVRVRVWVWVWVSVGFWVRLRVRVIEPSYAGCPLLSPGGGGSSFSALVVFASG